MDEIKSITIETSTTCNARCTICPNGYSSRKPHFMPLDELEAILRKFTGLETISLCGMYEPLTDWRVDEILGDIEKIHPDANIEMFTNAHLLDKFQAILVRHKNFNYLTCSVHGYSKSVYESIMVGLNRDRVYKNVLDFVELKGGLGKRPFVRVTFVRIKQNIHELEEFRDFWSNKVDLVSDYEPMNWRGVVPINELLYDNPDNTRPCPMFEWPIVIDAYGNIVRCCYCFDRNYGHVLKDGIENWKNKVWSSNTYPEKDCMSCLGWRYY